MDTEGYDPKKWLIDSRTCDYFENSSDYDVLVRELDYGRGEVDLMEIDTDSRLVNYFNFYLQGGMPDDEWDIPSSTPEESNLDRLLGENNWAYMPNPRRVSWENIDYQPEVTGDIYVSSETDTDQLGDLFEVLTGDREGWRELSEIDPEQCR